MALWEKTDENGIVVARKTWDDGGNLLEDIRFSREYHANGRMRRTEAVDSSGRKIWSREYDADGQVILEH
jgi:hypothetical protein